MKILVINCGSSSIKYSLFDMDSLRVLISGLFERIGEPQSIHKYHSPDANGTMHEISSNLRITDHRQGLSSIIQILQQSGIIKSITDLYAIGHRVVHGGELFQQPTLIDKAVLTKIRKMIPLAPLHNPANLMGIEVTLQEAKNTPQVAVFDTAYHQSMPAHAFHYAIPRELYQQEHIRRYGFHGTSHFYVAKQAAILLHKSLNSLNLITLHLGNGGSVTAIRQGKSIDTSMGMTPLEGLVMGTRSGDIDPAIPFYLNQIRGMSSVEIDNMLNKESGLKGLCGENDMRAIHQMASTGNENAQLAIDLYCYRIKKYIGAYCGALGQVDAIVFTGGIGENDAQIREIICTGLEIMGIAIEPNKNNQPNVIHQDISKNKSPVAILVISTNEELEIALQSLTCIKMASLVD